MNPRNVSRLTENLLHDERTTIGAGRKLRGIVMGDQTAHRNPGKVVEQRQHGFEYHTAHVLEIDIDATRASSRKFRRQVRLAVVQAILETKFIFDISALFQCCRQFRSLGSP